MASECGLWPGIVMRKAFSHFFLNSRVFAVFFHDSQKIFLVFGKIWESVGKIRKRMRKRFPQNNSWMWLNDCFLVTSLNRIWKWHFHWNTIIYQVAWTKLLRCRPRCQLDNLKFQISIEFAFFYASNEEVTNAG